MTRLLGLLACLAALWGAAPALAQQSDTLAPPGNSAIDEYLETVPGADGNRRVDRTRPGGLAPRARRALERLGADGKLAAEVLGASVSSDPAVRRAARSRGSSPSSGTGSAPDARGTAGAAPDLDAGQGRSGVAAVADSVLAGSPGGPSMGALLPVLLLGTVVFFTLSLVLRRRRG